MGAEKLFENKIKNYLADKHCWYVKFFANAYTKVGVPDILACVNGRFVAVEVKAPNGKPSPIQLWNIEEIKKSNGIALVLYPKDFDKFKLLVDNLLNDHNYKFEKW